MLSIDEHGTILSSSDDDYLSSNYGGWDVEMAKRFYDQPQDQDVFLAIGTDAIKGGMQWYGFYGDGTIYR